MRLIESLLLLSSVVMPVVCRQPLSRYIRHGISEDEQHSAASTTTAWPAYKPTDSPMFQLSSDEQFAFYLSEVLTVAENGGANTGEVLRIASQIVPHDFESVYNAFYYMAEHIHAMAESVNATRDPVGARDAYFRAATYYRGADFFLKGNWSDLRITTLWEQQTASFDKALALVQPVPGERVNLKAHSETVGDFEVPIIFYKASTCNEATPTLILDDGYDASQEEIYHQYARNVLLRGINVVTYEGPGQPTVVRQQKLGFIPDWWSVVNPVVDYLATRPDVDMTKLALQGVSYGGLLAPLAATREPRLSAVIALDGMINFQQILNASFPKEIVELYASGNESYFNEVIRSIMVNSTYPSNYRWLLDQSLWAFQTESAFDWYTRAGKIVINEENAKNLSMPIFVAKAQDDTLTLNQPELAYELYTTGRPNGKELTTYHQFNTSLGAGEHCSLGAEAQVSLVTLNWLSDVWGGVAFKNNL